jgi:hypothetical protein
VRDADHDCRSGGIGFGNGLNAQQTNALFFAAAPNGGTNGLYGRLDIGQ